MTSCTTGLPERNEDASTGGVLGDFRLVREIGRGGMGVVYEAEQISLGRRVALKVLPFAAILDKQQLKRFKNEARAAATLSHPNIVAVHSVGEVRSVYFFAMQLVEGRNLAQVIAELQKTHGVKAGETDVTGGATNTFSAKDATPAKSDDAALLPAAETRRHMHAVAEVLDQLATHTIINFVRRFAFCRTSWRRSDRAIPLTCFPSPVYHGSAPIPCRLASRATCGRSCVTI